MNIIIIIIFQTPTQSAAEQISAITVETNNHHTIIEMFNQQCKSRARAQQHIPSSSSFSCSFDLEVSYFYVVLDFLFPIFQFPSAGESKHLYHNL